MSAGAAAPRLVIVTDRRLVRDPDERRARLDAMLAALPPGAAVVQVREKDLAGGALFDEVARVIAAARPRGAAVLVNDRLDVALAAGADGVHLPEDGLAIVEARAIAARCGRDVIVGVSRHAPAAAAAAARAGADLVLLGPVRATPSKAAHGPPLGDAALAAARAAWGPGPARLVAIGGIEAAADAAAARAAGADAVAAIRALWTAADPAAAARALAGAG